jgi:OOP family OmpA-OmpF porin
MEIRHSALALALLAFGTAAHADDHGGFYAGSGAGLYFVEIDDVDYDESAATVRAFGGYRLNEYVSFEAGFTHLFESSGDIFGVKAKLDGIAWDMSVRPMLPLNEQFEMFGVLGWTRYEFDVSASGGGITVSDKESESDLMYGLGGLFNVTDNWSVRGEWIMVDVDDADLGMLSVSATYRFR